MGGAATIQFSASFPGVVQFGGVSPLPWRDRDELNRPVAFAAWGLLSPEAEAKLRQPFGRLLAADWKSGDPACVLILAVPADKTAEIVKDLGRTSLEGKPVSLLRAASEGWSVVHLGASEG